MFQTYFENCQKESQTHKLIKKSASSSSANCLGSIQKPQRALAPHIRAWNGEAHLGDPYIKKVLSGTKNGNKVILPHFRPPHAQLLC